MHIINNEKILTYIDYMPVYNGLNITEFGEETSACGDHGNFLGYRHNHIVHFVLEGTGTFFRDGKTYALAAGKAFVITPKNLIRYEATKESSWKYCWLSFTGTDCDTLFEQCGFTENNAVFDFQESDIRPLLDELAFLRKEKPQLSPAYPLAALSMSFEVLKNCAARLRVDEPKKQVSSSIVDTAVAYMQANLHKPMSISALCADLCISRTYFSTLFETTLKQPPYQYLQNLRIQKASELLLSDLNRHVYEIAEMVGFSSTAQFCKAFHKVIGCRPSEFRIKYQKSDGAPTAPRR